MVPDVSVSCRNTNTPVPTHHSQEGSCVDRLQWLGLSCLLKVNLVEVGPLQGISTTTFSSWKWTWVWLLSSLRFLSTKKYMFIRLHLPMIKISEVTLIKSRGKFDIFKHQGIQTLSYLDHKHGHSCKLSMWLALDVSGGMRMQGFEAVTFLVCSEL